MRECIICNRSQPFYIDSHLTYRFTESNVILEDQLFYCFPGADKRTRQLDVGWVRLLTSLTHLPAMSIRPSNARPIKTGVAATARSSQQNRSTDCFDSQLPILFAAKKSPSSDWGPQWLLVRIGGESWRWFEKWQIMCRQAATWLWNVGLEQLPTKWVCEACEASGQVRAEHTRKLPY